MLSPLREGQHVARPHGVAADGVLHHRQQHGQAHGQVLAHHQAGERQGVGRAAHVLLHVAHARRGLDVQPAGVEHHALADQRQVGRVLASRAAAPGDLDHAGRASGSGGAPDGVDGGVVALQQRVPRHDVDVGPVGLSHRARGGLDLGRPHIVGRRVDHVASQRAGAGDPPGAFPHARLHAAEPRPRGAGLGLVALEAIAAERPSGRRRFAGHAVSQAVFPGRQTGGERAQRLWVGLPIPPRGDARHDLAHVSVGSDHRQHLACCALEALRMRLRLRRRPEPGQQVGRPDRVGEVDGGAGRTLGRSAYRQSRRAELQCGRPPHAKAVMLNASLRRPDETGAHAVAQGPFR